jgi:glycosyltransferase involved in cell wall biosynthesis
LDKFRLAVLNTQPPHLYFGGVERRIIETAKRLQNQVEITVYSGTKAGFKEPSAMDGARLVPCYSTDKLFPLDNWFFNRSLSKKVDSIKADVYEAHTASGYGLLKAINKRGIKKPFIHTIHGVLAEEYQQAKEDEYKSFRSRIANYFMHRLAESEAETARKATLIVTISKYSLEKIKTHYHANPTKARIVPNGVDPEKFKPQENVKAAKQQLGLGNEPCILFVGGLIPRKGLHFLVEAAEKIVKEHSETNFLIAGEGPLKNRLLTAVRLLNLSSNFRFLGGVKESILPTLYGCADAFVLPSIQEGQGIVLLEAQASAKPVVAFDVGGVNETVRNGETGLLVKKGSTDELVEALLKLLSDKGLREKMGSNGRKFVTENLTWEICAQKMLNVYHEALAIGNVDRFS